MLLTINIQGIISALGPRAERWSNLALEVQIVDESFHYWVANVPTAAYTMRKQCSQTTFMDPNRVLVNSNVCQTIGQRVCA